MGRHAAARIAPNASKPRGRARAGRAKRLDGAQEAHAGAEAARAVTSSSPRILSLTRDEMEAILARNHLGRLAYSFHDRVDIEPIHYVYGDGVLYGRTSPGSKLMTLAHRPWIAFEVDEMEGLFDWRSVVVHGSVYVVEDSDARHEHDIYERTLERVRSLVPNALLDDDPTPHRSVLFRIHIDTMSGRKATHRTGHAP